MTEIIHVICGFLYTTVRIWADRQLIHRWWLFPAGIFLILLSLGEYHIIQKERKHSRMLKMQMDMMEDDCRELRRLHEEKEILLHDVKNHLRIIRGLAEAGGNQEILCYLYEMDGVLQKGRNRNLVNHDLVNLVLNQKFQEAENAGISLRYEMDDISGLLLKYTEICALFSNMLDNAIEANGKITEGMERWIELTCTRKGQMLLLHISNPMSGTGMQFSGEFPQTTKRNKSRHGYGMRSIRHIVNMHDGHMLVEAKDGIFKMTVCVKGF